MSDILKKILDVKAEEVAAAKKRHPRVPEGYRPKKGEQVVAQWSEGSWYTGQVDSISGERATVSWPGSSFKPSEIQTTRVAPYPSAAGAELPAVGPAIVPAAAISHRLYPSPSSTPAWREWRTF